MGTPGSNRKLSSQSLNMGLCFLESTRAEGGRFWYGSQTSSNILRHPQTSSDTLPPAVCPDSISATLSLLAHGCQEGVAHSGQTVRKGHQEALYKEAWHFPEASRWASLVCISQARQCPRTQGWLQGTFHFLSSVVAEIKGTVIGHGCWSG